MKESTALIDVVSDRIMIGVGSTTSLIIHTILFIAAFASHLLFNWQFNTILLVLTTIVSLEAIYLAIFIQRSVNQQAERLEEVEEALDEVEETLDDVEESIEDVEESLNEAEEDIEGIPADTLKQLQKPMADLANQMKELVEELAQNKKKK